MKRPADADVVASVRLRIGSSNGGKPSESVHRLPKRVWAFEAHFRRACGAKIRGTRTTKIARGIGHEWSVTVNSGPIASLQLRIEQRLADMTSNRIVGDWRLDRRISIGDD